MPYVFKNIFVLFASFVYALLRDRGAVHRVDGRWWDESMKTLVALLQQKAEMKKMKWFDCSLHHVLPSQPHYLSSYNRRNLLRAVIDNVRQYLFECRLLPIQSK